VGTPPTKSWHLLCLSDETLGWETGIEFSTKRKTKDLQRTEKATNPPTRNSSPQIYRSHTTCMRQ
jgi:hypothetical protein